MPFVSLLLLLLASGAPSPPAPPEALVTPHDDSRALLWAGSSVVSSAGDLRLLPGWRVRLGLGGRAHLLGPSPRAPEPGGPWDDEAVARGVRVSVRVTARDGDAVYVEGRLRQGDRARSFLLRWDAASGTWAEAT